MHLLTETAIGDSKQYEVLSIEELDKVKKELALLSSRTIATKRKLALETKLLDAAHSINRLSNSRNGGDTLDGPQGSPKRQRRSNLGRRISGSGDLGKSDSEMVASTKKCEELSQELWRVEKRTQDLHRRLLEHTAGILQMTHMRHQQNRSADTPESMVSFADSRGNTKGIDGIGHFDSRSLYHAQGPFDEFGISQVNGHPAPSAEFMRQTEAILDTEKRVEDLNVRLKDYMTQTHPECQELPIVPQSSNQEEHDSGLALQEQVQCLEQSVEIMHKYQNETKKSLERQIFNAEERLEDSNVRVHEIVSRIDYSRTSQYPLPPQATGKSLFDQLGYLSNGLDAVERQSQNLTRALQESSSQISRHTETSKALTGLWDTMHASESKGDYSLQSFVSKVQSTHLKATSLEEQKDVLTRQIQQQRELNNQSDAERDVKFADLTSQLEHTRAKVDSAEREAKGSKDELLVLTERLEVARQELNLREQQRGMDESNALKAEKVARQESEERMFAELQNKQDAISDLEMELAGLKDDAGIAKVETEGKLAESEKRSQRLAAQLAEAEESRMAIEANAAFLKDTIGQESMAAAKAQEEMKGLESEVVRLQTELTVARAELDSAYGTRAERAANNDSSAGDAKELAARVQTLQKELSETIAEYEVMTKSSIEFEREREQLENLIDGLRDRCENLEGQLSDERVQSLGLKSPGIGNRDSAIGGNTSTMVLKNEFKKMMRETRAENMKALRVS